MQLGVIFPQTESGTDVGAVREFVQAVEAMGFDFIEVFDHVVGASRARLAHLPWAPYDHESLFHEVFVFFGWVAAFTKHIGLTNGILVLPQRETALVAKQAAEVDLLSGGRLRLGVGVGWNDVEYASLGADFHSRGARQAEQIELLRRLWTERLVSFSGKWHQLDQVGIKPLPVQRPIPVWLGGAAERTLDRMARLGDGWISNTIPSRFEETRQTLAALREKLQANGRDPARFGLEGWVRVKETPESQAATVGFWREVGATHLAINSLGAGLQSLTDHLKALEAFRKQHFPA